jgi:hypothetical protein
MKTIEILRNPHAESHPVSTLEFLSCDSEGALVPVLPSNSTVTLVVLLDRLRGFICGNRCDSARAVC